MNVPIQAEMFSIMNSLLCVYLVSMPIGVKSSLCLV